MKRRFYHICRFFYRNNIGSNIKTVLLNPYWWAVALLWGLTGGHYALIGGTLPYYCKYIFGNDGLYSPLYTMEVLLWCVMDKVR